MSRRTLGLSITSSALKVSPQGSKLEPFPSEFSRQKLSRLPHKGRNSERKEDRRVFTCSHFENFLLKTTFLDRSPSLEFGRSRSAPPPRRRRTISPFRCPTLCDTQTSVSSVKGQRICSLLLPRGNTDPGWQNATGHAPPQPDEHYTPPTAALPSHLSAIAFPLGLNGSDVMENVRSLESRSCLPRVLRRSQKSFCFSLQSSV